MTDNWYDSIVTAVKTAIEAVFLKKSDIVDNLTTNNSNKALSARQGKLLKDELGDIHTLIYGTGEE